MNRRPDRFRLGDAVRFDGLVHEIVGLDGTGTMRHPHQRSITGLRPSFISWRQRPAFYEAEQSRPRQIRRGPSGVDTAAHRRVRASALDAAARDRPASSIPDLTLSMAPPPSQGITAPEM
jgi:hypothetical protein